VLGRQPVGDADADRAGAAGELDAALVLGVDAALVLGVQVAEGPAAAVQEDVRRAAGVGVPGAVDAHRDGVAVGGGHGRLLDGHAGHRLRARR